MKSDTQSEAEWMSGLLPLHSASETDTQRIGRQIAERLTPGDIVALYGDLGAGKTILTKGIADGLGIDAARVKSPTFTLLHEYADGRLPLFHFDAYRIEGIAEFFDLGYEDYFYGDGVCVIEWAEKIEPLLPEDALRIRLRHDAGRRRRIETVDG